MPQLFLLGIDTPPQIILEAQRSLLQATARMGAGQRLDLQFRSQRGSNLDAAYECVRLKSGAAVEILANLGAIVADAPQSRRQCYGEFGNALGCQWSLTGDWRELMRGEASEDLRNGTHSWPLALLFSAQKDMRTQPLRRPAGRRANQRRKPRRGEVAIDDSGVGQMVNLTIEWWGQRAMRALEAARPLEPARSELITYLQILPPSPK